MEPPRLCFIGLQLLTLAYTTQSLVMLTANSEDVKKLAQKFVSESLADKIAEFLAISTGKIVENLSKENDLNDVHKDISMGMSDSIDRDDFDFRNREIHQEGKPNLSKPIRETKDLNTPPLREIKLDIASLKKPENSQGEIDDRKTSAKLKAKRASLLKKYNKQKKLPYRPSKILRFDQERKVDRYAHFGDHEKPLNHPRKVIVDPKRDLVNNDNRHLHHPHIDLETIDEEKDNTEKQSKEQRKKIKQLYRKPSQPNRDLLRLTNQFPKHKQVRQNPINIFKQAHIGSIGNFKQDPSHDFQQDDIEILKQDSNGNANHDHISEFQHDPIYNFKQDHIGDKKQDHIDDVKKDHTDNFKQDPIGNFDQEPTYETEFKPHRTEKLKRQSTFKPLRIGKELFEHKKTYHPQSKQPKQLSTEFKDISHTGKNKAQIINLLKLGHHYPHHKLYKPRMPTAEVQHNYEDAVILEQLKNVNKVKSESHVKDSLRIVDRYPIHKQTYHLEPKLDKNKNIRGETELAENNDNRQSSIVAPFLTTKIPISPSIVDEKTSFVKQAKKLASNFPNNSHESEDMNITERKDDNFRRTQSTEYHGDHKVTKESTNNEFDAKEEDNGFDENKEDNKSDEDKEDNEFNLTKEDSELEAQTKSSEASNLKDYKEITTLWEQIATEKYKRPTSKKLSVLRYGLQ